MKLSKRQYSKLSVVQLIPTTCTIIICGRETNKIRNIYSWKYLDVILCQNNHLIKIVCYSIATHHLYNYHLWQWDKQPTSLLCNKKGKPGCLTVKMTILSNFLLFNCHPPLIQLSSVSVRQTKNQHLCWDRKKLSMSCTRSTTASRKRSQGFCILNKR